jgi:hypothetical protein
VSLFVLSPELKTETQLRSTTGRNTKRASTLNDVQDVIESCTDILTTSYWLHVELGKNI